jgi:hypothetical protein
MTPRIDPEAAQKSLAQATSRLSARLDSLKAYLDGSSLSAVERVANAPETTLAEVTERARKHWDSLEGRRSSVPPPRR